jgi:hypothetical protein
MSDIMVEKDATIQGLYREIVQLLHRDGSSIQCDVVFKFVDHIAKGGRSTNKNETRKHPDWEQPSLAPRSSVHRETVPDYSEVARRNILSRRVALWLRK